MSTSTLELIYPDATAVRDSARARRAAMARKGSRRRRFVDPSTCDRQYSTEELEFIKAIQAFKDRSGRAFPSCGEILDVLGALGYRRSSLTENSQVESLVS